MVFHFVGSSLHFESALKSIFLLFFFQVEFLLIGATLLTYLGAGRLGPPNLFDHWPTCMGRLGFNSSLVALSGLFSVPFGLSIGREFVNGG
jgi:hypothetical protein